MALSVAWSVQGAAWLEQLDYLAPLAVWAVVIGAAVGVLRLTILISLPFGAVIGAAMVIWMIGGEYFTELSQLGRLVSLRTDLIGWTAVVLDTGYPSQMSPYALGLGVLMWATAFTASYVVYRYHRVLDAILLLGAALLINISPTFADLFGHFLLFVVAALLLWLRAALVNRQDGWQRRRVNETLEVPSAILRTGIIFAGASVLLAWVLTSVAVAAPLTGAWRNLDTVWSGVRDSFEGVLGGLTNPQSRITGDSFGQSFTVFGEWVSSDEEVLVLAAERPLYLRTVTYDQYTGRGWEYTSGPQRGVAAGDPLFLVPTTERPIVEDAVRPERIAIEMRQTMGRDLFTAGSPHTIYAPSLIEEPIGLPLLAKITSPNALSPGESYELDILVSTATEAELAAAGDDYPPAVRDLYLDTTGITERVAGLAREVVENADAANPYEQAAALVRFFRSSLFEYSTIGPEVPPDGDVVDTFLFAEEGARRGYCQHFASAMAMMARSLGLPARVAGGLAPGEAAGEGLWLSREANLHAWVEIYFPGYGWEIFEATKSISPRFFRGTGDPTTARPPTQGIDPFLEEELLAEALRQRGFAALQSPVPVTGAIDPTAPEAPPAEGSGARLGNAMVMVVLVGIAVVFIAFQMRRSKRRWRLLPAGDRAWRQLTSAADRAGVGPRPAETIYEYAGWLEEQLPKQIEPIRVVADGKVMQSYSGRPLTRSGSNKLDAAIRRLQRPLWLLGLRRWLRRSTRRDDLH
jgi:transglutaminase-like putative cysteine protease